MPLLSLFLMIVFGAIITGIVILLFINASFAEDDLPDSLWVAIISFLGSILVGTGLGGAIGGAVGLGGRIGKNRNGLSALIVGSVFGLIASFAGFSTGNFASIGVLYGIIITIMTIICSAGVATSIIQGSPFCETCQKYMKKLKIKRASLSHGTIMLSLLQANNYHEVIKLTSTTDSNNCCKLIARYCKTCNNGYIFMFIVKDSKEQLVFSSPIKSKDLQGIIKELNNIV